MTMCYLPIEDYGDFFIKSARIYCCPCYFDTLILTKFNGKKYHEKIVEKLNILNIPCSFTMILNDRLHLFMICLRYVSNQMVNFNDIDCKYGNNDYIYLTFETQYYVLNKLF